MGLTQTDEMTSQNGVRSVLAVMSNIDPSHAILFNQYIPTTPACGRPGLDSPLPQLVLLDLQCSLQNLLSLGSSDGSVNGNLFVPSDGERSDSVSGLGCDGGLTGKLF